MDNFSSSSVLTLDNDFIAIATNEYSVIVSFRFMVYLKEHVHKEMKKHKKNYKRKFLNLKEIFNYKAPDNIPINAYHIGVLYVLDSDKTGMFTFDKIYSFYEFVVQHSKNIKD